MKYQNASIGVYSKKFLTDNQKNKSLTASNFFQKKPTSKYKDLIPINHKKNTNVSSKIQNKTDLASEGKTQLNLHLSKKNLNNQKDENTDFLPRLTTQTENAKEECKIYRKIDCFEPLKFTDSSYMNTQTQGFMMKSFYQADNKNKLRGTMDLLGTSGKTGNLGYIKDLLSQYQAKKYEIFKVNTQMNQGEEEKDFIKLIGNSRSRAQNDKKDKNQIIVLKKHEINEQLKHTNQMDQYYNKLEHLKNRKISRDFDTEYVLNTKTSKADSSFKNNIYEVEDNNETNKDKKLNFRIFIKSKTRKGKTIEDPLRFSSRKEFRRMSTVQKTNYDKIEKNLKSVPFSPNLSRGDFFKEKDEIHYGRLHIHEKTTPSKIIMNKIKKDFLEISDTAKKRILKEKQDILEVDEKNEYFDSPVKQIPNFEEAMNKEITDNFEEKRKDTVKESLDESEIKLFTNEYENIVKTQDDFFKGPKIKKIEDYEYERIDINTIPKMKMTENEMKNEILERFLNKNSDKLKSNHLDYRKIYVIIDGSIILNKNIIPGKYISILKSKLSIKTTKKEKLENFYKFINEANNLFQPPRRLTSVFLSDGTPIFDLNEIPRNDRCVFISHIPIFRGLKLTNYSKIVKYEELNKNNKSKSKGPLQRLKFFENLKKKKLNFLKRKFLFKKTETTDLSFKKKFFKEFKENSFYQTREVDDWLYISDNENSKKLTRDKLGIEHKSKAEIIIYFTDEWADWKEKYYRKQLKSDENGNIKEKYLIKEDLKKLVDKYNEERDGNKKIKKKEKDKNISQIYQNTNNFMKKFIEKLGIIKTENPDNYDNDLLEEYQQEKYRFKNRFRIKNKERVQNLYFTIDQNVNKFYPDLIKFNIPKLISENKSLTRRELIELFVQYKTLIKICIALNKSIDYLKKGVDFKTFHQGVSQMAKESEDLAQKIFKTINERGNNYLSWDEFLKGMITIKSSDIADKIDMFFKIIDTDGNGLLSYDEVLQLSLASLQRNIKGDDENSKEIVEELARYFADLIFKLVDIDKRGEIPLPKIKEVI